MHTWKSSQLKGALCLPIKVGDCKVVWQKIEHVRVSVSKQISRPGWLCEQEQLIQWRFYATWYNLIHWMKSTSDENRWNLSLSSPNAAYTKVRAWFGILSFVLLLILFPLSFSFSCSLALFFLSYRCFVVVDHLPWFNRMVTLLVQAPLSPEQ